jgi:hypothetical protein
MSVLYIGAYAWSIAAKDDSFKSESRCEATSVSHLTIEVSNVPCSLCTARTDSGRTAYGAISYGGSISVLYVGAYAYSNCFAVKSDSRTGATTVVEAGISVSDSPCFNCSAITTTTLYTFGAHSFGGSMSVLYIGAYAYSYSNEGRSSIQTSTCGSTSASVLSISVANSSCVYCVAQTYSGYASFGANSYGGSISAVYIGAMVYMHTIGGFKTEGRATYNDTHTHNLALSMNASEFHHVAALSRTSAGANVVIAFSLMFPLQMLCSAAAALMFAYNCCLFAAPFVTFQLLFCAISVMRYRFMVAPLV